MPVIGTWFGLAGLLALAPAAFPCGWLRAQDPDDPREVVRRAVASVEGDSARSVRSGWEARLRRDSTDRAALLGLATLARLTYDYPAAERLYRRLLPADGAPDRYAAYAHLGAALGFDIRSRNAEAGAEFTAAREAAVAAGDRVAEGEALVHLTFNRGRLRGVDVAEATLDSASRLIPESELALQARIAERRAIIASLRGRPEAQALAESAVALARRSGELGVEGDAWLALGKVIQYRGAFDSALVVLRRSEEVYERARNGSAVARSLIWHAQVLASRGRFGEAREVMQRALALGAATHNPAAVADAHRAFGTLGIMLGDFPGAALHLERSAAISVESGDSASVRTTRKFLVDVALAGGDLDGARRLVRELIERATEPRDEFELWSSLAATEIRARRWAEAERAIGSARALLPRLPGPKAPSWLLHDEGRLALARGDLDAAERLIRSWIGESSDPAGDQMRYDAHVRLADIYTRRGELARAERELTLAWDELDHWRARLGDAQLRVLAFQFSPMQHAASSEVDERDARLARILAALAAGGRAEAAFALAERRRARELGDRLMRAEALRVGADSGARAPGVGREARAVEAATVAAALPDSRTALIEFVGGTAGAPTTAFVLRRSGVTSHQLATGDSLRDEVFRLAALLEQRGEPPALTRALGATLLDPVLAGLGPEVTRLVLVPDGALHHVPWDALRMADGRHLAERYAVSIVPSAAIVTALWRRSDARPRGRPGPVRLLAFGDPDFDGGDRAPETRSLAATGYRLAFDSAGGLPRLRASAREARLVARFAPGSEVRLRERASAAFLKTAPLDSFGVIHLATHALVDERAAARTVLALAPGAGESGFVGPGELAALRLRADLVFLSSCRSVRGQVVQGEGIQGLTAPLLEAGARVVVATHWRIGDETPLGFVATFYRALASGLPVTDALRAAKLDAIRRGAPPSEWAAFTAVGDPLVTVPLQLPPAEGRARLAGALALLAALAAGVVLWIRAAAPRGGEGPDR